MLQDPVALALGASLLFGSALVLTQLGLRHVPARLGALVSVPTTALLFLALAPTQLDLSAWNWKAVAIFAGVGIFFPAMVTLLTFEANRLMGPSVSGALGNATPLFAVLLAALVVAEVPRWGQLAGMAVVIAGAVLLSTDRRWLAGSWPLWAVALPLGGAAIRGFAQPVIKVGLAIWPSPFAAVLVGYTVSAAVIGTVAAASGRAGARAFRPSAIPWFAAVGVCNGIALLATYAGLARGPVVLVSPLVATYPLVTVVLSALFLRQARLGPGRLAGIVMTVLGVAILLQA